MSGGGSTSRERRRRDLAAALAAEDESLGFSGLTIVPPGSLSSSRPSPLSVASRTAGTLRSRARPAPGFYAAAAGASPAAAVSAGSPGAGALAVAGGVGGGRDSESGAAGELDAEEFRAAFPHNMGDTPVSLQSIRKSDGAKRCFALIGKGQHRICLEAVMRGKKYCPRHRGGSVPKYQFEEEEEMHIPSKAIGGLPAVYTSPRIGRTKILPEHLDAVLGDVRTTARWAVDLPRYAAAFEAHGMRASLEEATGLGEAPPGVDEEDEEGDDDPLLAYLVQGDPLGYTPLPASATYPLEFEGDVDAEAPNAQAILATREAIGKLFGMVESMSAAAPGEGLNLSEFVGPILDSVMTAVNEAILAVVRLREEVGDVPALRPTLGRSFTLAEAVTHTFKATPPLGEFEALRERVDALGRESEELQDEFAETVLETSRTSLRRVKACLDRIAEVEAFAAGLDARHPPTGAPVRGFGAEPMTPRGGGALQIPFNAVFTDQSGAPVMSAAELLQSVMDAKSEREDLLSRVRQLEAAVEAQGGVNFEDETFTSLDEVLLLVMEEDPQGQSLAAFTTPLTIFAHDSEYKPCSDWRSATKAMERTGGYTDAERKFVNANSQRYPVHYVGTSAAEAGKTLTGLATKKAWTGHAGLDGTRAKVEKSIGISKRAASTYIRKKLPAGSRLRGLAEAMLRKTDAWYSSVHNFFDKDLMELTDLGVSVEETLTLLSEYVIIMFDVFYMAQQQLNQFAETMPKADYVAPVIWVGLQIHAEMDKFVANGNMKHNSALASAFIRFLTKATAKNNSSGLGNRISRLEEKWDGADIAGLAKDVKSVRSKMDTFHNAVNHVKEELKKKN